MSKSYPPPSSSRPSADTFALSLAFVLSREGGLSDDSADSGGLTKYGISQRAYPNVDIPSLTRDQAAAIYRRDYWDALGLDRLPSSVSMAVFDAAVNCGASAAIRQLQQALNAFEAGPPLVADGKLGPMTASAVQRVEAMGAIPSLLSELLLFRVQHYSDLCARKPAQAKFLRGWIARVIALSQAVRSVA